MQAHFPATLLHLRLPKKKPGTKASAAGPGQQEQLYLPAGSLIALQDQRLSVTAQAGPT